jgi:hypothetical protein
VSTALFQADPRNKSRSARLCCPLFAVLAGRDSVVDTAAARAGWLLARGRHRSATCPRPDM